MSNYDDDEAFADDDPSDLVYRVHVDQLRDHLVHQLHAIAERPDVDIDPDLVTHHVETRLMPRASRTGHVVIDRLGFDERLGAFVAHLDPETRRRVASEVLTAVSVLHEPEVG